MYTVFELRITVQRVYILLLLVSWLQQLAIVLMIGFFNLVAAMFWDLLDF